MLAAFQPPRESRLTLRASVRKGVFPNVIHMEHAISPGSCFPWQTSAFLLCLQRNRSQKAFQLMRRCGLPAENLSRSPMLTRFAYRYSPRFGREILAENAPHHLFGLLSACHVWDDCPLLPFRLPGSVHDWFSASLPSDASHTGRGGCLHEPEKMTGILGIRRSLSVRCPSATMPPFGTVHGRW